ncbi:acyltransferase family protein [Algibacter aquimarinus]|uniref:Acyltransferase 3 domain-containing protein n=1 Tax=Algibacter aquimarinus TaxID=1136748 RepID=A0ABP9HKR8_9FLAO
MKRNSSIELLRILFMLFIILFHFLGRNYNLFGVTNETAIWDENLLSKLIVHATGQLGVPGFVFISGYFGLKFNSYRFIDLLAQCFLYSFIFYSLISPTIGIFENRPFILSMFFLSSWWFMWSYILLYFISPALNSFIENMKKNQFIVLLFLLFFISIGLWIHKTSATNIFILLEIYFIARFVKIHLSDALKSKAWVLLLLSFILYYGLVAVGYFKHNLVVMPYVNSYYNPIIIVLTGSLIVTFERIKFSAKIINWVSPNLLAAYLITENFYGTHLFKNWFYIPNEYPILKFIGIGLGLTIICVLVDKFRLLLFSPTEKRLAIKLEKWMY